jgi:hypothetical protein
VAISGVEWFEIAASAFGLLAMTISTESDLTELSVDNCLTVIESRKARDVGIQAGRH